MLKDWMKLKNNYPFVKGFFDHMRTNNKLTIKHIKSAGKYPYFYPASYDVILNYKKLLKKFKNLKQANDYAKEYMRKH